MAWLIRLRWAQVVGQAITITLAELVPGVALPLMPLAFTIGVAATSNAALHWRYLLSPVRRSRGVAQWQLAAIMALDVALLTSLLYFTGGPTNPFGFLYVVQIALATVALEAAWTWTLVALSFLGFGALVIGHVPLPLAGHTQMIGMWVALGVASAFVVHFLLRITGALAIRDAELSASRQLAARQERLTSLATVAAGAAHELATPLGTVALVAKELERSLMGQGGEGALVEDARLIRTQVARCRIILDQMSGGASTAGEFVETRSVQALVDDAAAGIRLAPPVHISLSPAVAQLAMKVPPRALCQALRSIITNAQDASPPHAEVSVSALADDSHVLFSIADQGGGMPPEVLARVGEPFFTTKEPGHGTGLGLFLAQTVVDGLGGTLTIESVAGHGTTVHLRIPREVARAAAAEASAISAR